MDGSQDDAQRILRLDSNALRPHERAGHWDEMARGGVVGLRARLLGEADDFAVSSTLVLQEGLGAMSLQSSAGIVERFPDQLPDLWSDTVVVNFVRSGRLVIEQGGRSTVVSAGDGAICVADRPYLIRYDAGFDGAILKFSRRMFTCCPDLAEHTAQSMTAVMPTSALLFTLADTITRDAPMLDAVVNAKLMQVFVDTLEASFDAIGDHGSFRRGQQGATLTRVIAYIETTFRDPALTPSTLADALKLSPRYLGKLFATAGTTPGRYIWGRRLDASAKDLRDLARQQDSVTRIALRNGFIDMTHFARTFRARFGASPRAYRFNRSAAGGEE